MYRTKCPLRYGEQDSDGSGCTSYDNDVGLLPRELFKLKYGLAGASESKISIQDQNVALSTKSLHCTGHTSTKVLHYSHPQL